jgi:hypothetical protein
MLNWLPPYWRSILNDIDVVKHKHVCFVNFNKSLFKTETDVTSRILVRLIIEYGKRPGYGPVSYYGPGSSTVETANPMVLKFCPKKEHKIRDFS